MDSYTWTLQYLLIMSQMDLFAYDRTVSQKNSQETITKKWKYENIMRVIP